MRVDTQKYLAEVKRIEAELKAHKALMREAGYETSFDYGKLFALRAQVTRLYCLRAESRGKIHPIQGGFRIQHVQWRKEPVVVNMEGPNGARATIWSEGYKAMEQAAGAIVKTMAREDLERGVDLHGRRALQRLIIDGETGWKEQLLLVELPNPAQAQDQAKAAHV